MKISIITVTKNSERYIQRAVESVQNQTHSNVEHVIKDANSRDRTVEIATSVNPKVRVVCSADAGIYDAMNQGYLASTGDIVGFLNSDDFYCNTNILSEVASVFKENNCDVVYGNIKMIDFRGRIVRVWKTSNVGDRLYGNQLPHPAVFIRRSALELLHIPFDPSYKIAGDLKQQLLLMNLYRVSSIHINSFVAIMQLGGASTNGLTSYFCGWKESYRAYREVIGGGALYFVLFKVLSKTASFFRR